jgi:hypothetical protein
MTAQTLDHLINNVLPAAADYHDAERELSVAYNADNTAAAWEQAARRAKRRAAELAIAIDGLTDRLFVETPLSKTSIRGSISALCLWPGSGAQRLGAHDRVRGVANAYKHQNLTDLTLPIASQNDVLAVGLGYGLDGYGVGKYGGVEVIVQERDGTRFKFLGDAPVSIAAWFKFLAAQGAVIPPGPFSVCGLQVHP